MHAIRLSAALVAVGMSLVAVPAGAAVLGRTTTGELPLKSLDVIEFAPDGTLLVGDGLGAQVLAVATTEPAPAETLPARIENFRARVGERLGTTADGVELLDLAVHPRSGRVFVAVRHQAEKAYLILVLDGAGQLSEFPLSRVTYARVALPSSESAAVRKVADLAWADDRLVAAVATNEEFASKIFVAPGPLNHDARGGLFSAETYHVSHGRWETRAPMSVLMPYRESGRTYVVGAFACTPVVKYPLDALTPDALVKGTSMIELGSGNRPLDMFAYSKDGREYVLASTFRFHHEKRPFGPSPYWTVRFEQSLLADPEAVNERATRRLQGTDPATDRIQMVEAFHGVMQMDRLGADRAVVLRGGPEGRVDLEVLPLP